MADQDDFDSLTEGMTDRQRNEILAIAKALKTQYVIRRKLIAPRYRMDPDESKSSKWVKCANILREKKISPVDYVNVNFDRYTGVGYPMPGQVTSLNAIKFYEANGGEAALIRSANLTVKWHMDILETRLNNGRTVEQILDDPPSCFSPLICFCLARSVTDAARAAKYRTGALLELAAHPEYWNTPLGKWIPEGIWEKDGTVTPCGESVSNSVPPSEGEGGTAGDRSPGANEGPRSDF